MQVRSGRVASVAHGGDLVAGHHQLAGLHQCGFDVTVERDRAVRGADLDPHAEARCRTGGNHLSIGCSVDRSTHGVGDVESGVQGAPPGSKARCQHALGGKSELWAQKSRLPLRPLLSESRASGRFLSMDPGIKAVCHRDDLHPRRFGAGSQ